MFVNKIFTGRSDANKKKNYIKTSQPSLNAQVNNDVLNLYRNIETQIPHVFGLTCF